MVMAMAMVAARGSPKRKTSVGTARNPEGKTNYGHDTKTEENRARSKATKT